MNADLLEVLAVAAHGGAVVIHSLGLTYNVLRSRKIDLDAGIHAAALLFSLRAVFIHARRVVPPIPSSPEKSH